MRRLVILTGLSTLLAIAGLAFDVPALAAPLVVLMTLGLVCLALFVAMRLTINLFEAVAALRSVWKS